MSDHTDAPKRLVLYHGGGCRDGFVAAWCAWLRFGAEAEYRPVTYGRPPPADISDFKEVYVLDFSWRPDELMAAMSPHQRVIVLDHHATAFDAWRPIAAWNNERQMRAARSPGVSGLLLGQIDLDRSGARMAWDYFRDHWSALVPAADVERIEARPGAAIFGEAMPLLVAYAEDRDLWRWQMPESREVNAVIQQTELDFDRFAELAKRIASNLEDVALEGATILRTVDAAVEWMTRKPGWISWLGHQAAIISAPVYHSEACNRLLEEHPDAQIAVSWAPNHDTGTVSFSLRSRPGGVDVAKLLEPFGGGGHAQAAGLKMPMQSAFNAIVAGQAFGAVLADDLPAAADDEAWPRGRDR